MNIANVLESPKTKVLDYPYKGVKYPVKEVWIQWLSQAGVKDFPEYGLRLFTIGPGGEIPIHNHLYYQTMYILTGRLLMVGYDGTTDAKVVEREIGPGDVVFIPTMEPHSLHNVSNTEQCTLLCCIANVYEDEE
jgi:quercetin dioxygenase-like cupin family protein